MWKTMQLTNDVHKEQGGTMGSVLGRQCPKMDSLGEAVYDHKDG